MQWLAEICVRRPVFATVIILALSVIGFFGYTKLGTDRFPKVDFPIVTVVLQQDGASPEEMETEVVDKVEEAVNTVSGIDQLQSKSYEGYAVVSVTFQLEKNIDVAAQEVRDKVNGIINDLPTDLKPPTINKVDTDSAAIIEYALSSPGNIRDTTEYADKILRRQIESINGVGQVNLIGGRKRQVNLLIDPDKLLSYNLSPIDVQKTLAAQNLQVPGGIVDQNTRELTLRTYGRVPAAEQFGGIVIKKNGDTPIRISDVATVVDSVEDEATVAALNGNPTVLLSIQKQSGNNTVATIDAIKERVDSIRKTLPSGYDLRVTRDQSEFIKASTGAVKEHLIVGSILAAIVVLVFLMNFRTTIISAIAIPTSIVSTFGLMWFMGFTLNGLTLLALTLSVGIVIDDAIVVLENIYRFIEEKGMNPFEAAIEGTREIGLAVLATTLSLIAIFLPVAFMTGIVGRFLNSFGLTMAFAIFISLIVSFTLTPMLASRWLKKPKNAGVGDRVSGVGTAADSPDNMPIGVEQTGGLHGAAGSKGGESGSKESAFFKPIDRVYTWFLRAAMKRRWIVVLASILTFLSIGVIGPRVPFNFLPEDDESQFQIDMRAPEGTSLEATKALGSRVVEQVRKMKGVDYAVLTIGNNQQKTRNLLEIYVKMVPTDKRSGYSQQDAMQAARDTIIPLYGSVRASVTPVSAIPGAGAPAGVSYTILGPDLKVLQDASIRAVQQMRSVPNLIDPDSDLVVGQPELGVRIDRKKTADLGVSVSDIANALRLAVGGAKVSDYNEGGEQYEVHVRSELPFRQDEQRIGQLTVPSTVSPLGFVTLNDVVTFTHGTGPSQIVRLNRQRQVTLTANVRSGAGSGQVQAGRGGHREETESAAGLYDDGDGQLEGAGEGGHRVPVGVRAGDYLHVPDPGGAVRVVGASVHDFDCPAADAAVRAAFDPDFPYLAEYLLHSGDSGAVRRREEERDFAGRPHEPTASAGHEPLRRHYCGEPRPPAPDFDDFGGVRGRSVSAGLVERGRIGNEPQYRLHGHWRADALAAFDAAGDAGVLLAVRRHHHHAAVGQTARPFRPRDRPLPPGLTAKKANENALPRMIAARRFVFSTGFRLRQRARGARVRRRRASNPAPSPMAKTHSEPGAGVVA